MDDPKLPLTGFRRVRFLSPSSVSSVVYRVALLAAFSALSSCSSMNPFNVAEEAAAFLQNQRVIDGRAMYTNQFVYVNGEYLDIGLFSNKSLLTAKYTAPAGQLLVKVKVDYIPRLPVHFPAPELIYGYLSFTAEQGKTYQIACRISDSLAYLRIEDMEGNQVSETLATLDYFGNALPPPSSSHR